MKVCEDDGTFSKEINAMKSVTKKRALSKKDVVGNTAEVKDHGQLILLNDDAESMIKKASLN